MQTLEDILISVNSYVDLAAELPTGDELSTRTNYANRAIWDATAVYQFPEFNKVYSVTASTSATLPLPSGFREFKGNPKQYTGGVWQEYEEVDFQERYNKSSGDRYCYVLGNPQEGYVVVFNNLISGDTLNIDYQQFPSGFATLTSVCELADPTYVATKVESYILQARGDDRFPTVDANAEKKLRNLVGRKMKSPGGQYRVSPVGFRNPLA